MPTVQLVLVRHAEAADGSLFGDDSQRELTQRGQREAAFLCRTRRMMSVPTPDVVFTSGYERAEQTLERALEGLSLRIVRDINFSPEGSYRKAWEMILDESRRPLKEEDRLKCIWVVGHNPNIERLLSLVSPEVSAVLRPFRKASLAWLKLRDVESHH
ncbi:MAG: SixA phosphatase family protein, partial [Silvanigrellaceae bacterium]